MNQRILAMFISLVMLVSLVSPALAQTPTATSGLTGPGGALRIACNDDAGAKALTGVDVQGLGTEDCSWVKRKSPEAEPATCPVGFVCTLHEGDDADSGEVVVQVGRGQKLDIVAGTFRQVNGFKRGDAVYNVCRLYANEFAWGQKRIPVYDTFYRQTAAADPATCPNALMAAGSTPIAAAAAAATPGATPAAASGPAPVGDTSSAKLDELIKQLTALIALLQRLPNLRPAP